LPYGRVQSGADPRQGGAHGGGEVRGPAWTRRAVAAGLAATACAPAAPPTLTLWHAFGGREASAIAKSVAAYNATLAAGAVRARAVALPAAGFSDTIAAAIARGAGPDVFLAGHDRLGAWVDRGQVLEPIGFWADEALRGGFLPPLTDALTYCGELYGLPVAFAVPALVYNRAAAPDPPTTSSALVTQAQAFVDAPRGRFGLAYAHDDVFHHAALLNGFGGGVFDAQRRPILDHPGNLAAGDVLLRWRDGDQILAPDPGAALALFNARAAPFAIAGPAFVAAVARDIDIAVAPLPLLDEAAGAPMRPWFAVTAAFVARGALRPREAFDLAAYLAGPEGGRRLARDGGFLPAAAAFYAEPATQADAIVQGFRAQLDRAQPAPHLAEMALAWGPARAALKRMLAGDAPSAACWGQAQAALNVALAAARGRS
jgi:arabinogalactan oligomer / maltooligosaccharide transport system substrate-binding protein